MTATNKFIAAAEPGCTTCHVAFRNLAVLLVIFLSVTSMFAAHASVAQSGFAPTLTQYSHANWRVQDGNFGGQAISITQTPDGYLWVGTAAGLERYDGAGFRRWTLPLDRPVFAVQAARDGSLWVGQAASLIRLKDGQPTASFTIKGRVVGIEEDKAGGIWIARSRSPLGEGGACQVQGNKLRCFNEADGQLCESAATLTHDTSGLLWIGGATSACTWRPGAGETIGQKSGTSNMFGVQALQAQPDGSMLVGYMRPGRHAGLQVVRNGVSVPFKTNGIDGEKLEVTALLSDRSGALWIGTAAAGIYHVDRGRVDRYTSADGLSGDSVNAFFEDREGSVWVATGAGIDRFHPHAVLAFTTREGLGGDGGDSVLARRDGSVLVGLLHGISIFRNGVPAADESWTSHLKPYSVTSMLEDHVGRLWIGADDDLLIMDGTRSRSVRKADGEMLGTVLGLGEDNLQNVWVLVGGRPYRLYRISARGVAEEVHLPNGREPVALARGPDGAIWVADFMRDFVIYRSGRPEFLKGPKPLQGYHRFVVTQANDVIISALEGAYILRNGRWTVLDKARGMPCENMTVAAIDSRGSLWLRGQCGMIIIAKTDIQWALNHPNERVKIQLLDGVDGAEPGVPPFSPAVTMSTDGRLWFASDNVPLTVDPAHLPMNAVPPPVHIEHLIADHQFYRAGKSVSLPPGTRDLEIAYSGLSFVAPQKMQFRYRLSGVQDAWQDVGTRRSAFFMNLKPGRYRFQVIASNNDGVWNTTGDTLDFSIRPTFYQTLWFRLVVIGVLIGLVWLGVWLRVRYVTAEIETRLSERQAERMRIARELHDTLLQGVQGLTLRFQAVADGLPRDHKTRSLMDDALDRADEMMVEGRQRVHDLRIRTANGAMDERLNDLGEEMAKDSDAGFRLTVEGKEYPLQDVVRDEVEAIATEAIRNAFRHANAKVIEVVLGYQASHFHVGVRDDGQGIGDDIASTGKRDGHFGLEGMRERAERIGARLSVASGLGKGTEILLEVPANLAIETGMPRRLSDRLRTLFRRLSGDHAEG